MVILSMCGVSPINTAEIYSMIRRRECIAGLGGAAVWPVVARAQQTAMPVIGVLTASSEQYGAAGGPDAPLFAALYRGFNEAGYFEGRNITLLFQGADYHYDRLPALA